MSTLHYSILFLHTCEPVFCVSSVALHPREGKRTDVVDVPGYRRHTRVPAAHRSVRRHADDPDGIRPAHIDPHVHVIRPTE